MVIGIVCYQLAGVLVELAGGIAGEFVDFCWTIGGICWTIGGICWTVGGICGRIGGNSWT